MVLFYRFQKLPELVAQLVLGIYFRVFKHILSMIKIFLMMQMH